ncbi:MAG: motility associated factor glycosyltransferase family protein [Tissierellia bacterium]|nr:motility associated factor glycosyltransferase family protein [Tissierellia bacterium]
MLKENKDILKKAYPDLWNRLKHLDNIEDSFSVHIEETKRGHKTLWTEKEGKKVYIHSKYNPIREAEAIVEGYERIDTDTTVIFYGTGLGYHIDLFLRKFPNVNYYIYEPIPEMLYIYLSYNSLAKLQSLNLKDIILADNEEKIRSFFANLIDKSSGTFTYISLNSHKNIFSEEYNKFVGLFKQTLKDVKSSIGTNLAFQERWILNSMKNFKEVLNTPNILLEKKGAFQSKPALLVAAGPSLNEEIENVRYIKDNKLAYVFSVGSSINTLIHNDIYPHALCTYDPKIGNQTVIRVVKDKNIKDIPMIFGSSVGYETLIGYPGDKYHMITTQDTVSNYYLKNEDGSSINLVQDAPSIAVITLQLLYALGFSPIILVGQNLAYRGKKRHSDGVFYSREVTEEEVDEGIWVKDVYGNNVLTNEGFNSMRQQMEMYIKALPNMKVINTTRDGAHIEGTSFMELNKVIDKYLTEQVVEENWLEGNKTMYDKEYLKAQSEKMDRAYNRAFKLMDEYYNILDKIEKLIEKENFNKAEKMYIELDKALRKVEKNDFFTTFILPMKRVQYKLLADSIDSLNEEKNLAEKGRRIVNSFRNFMDLCKKDMFNLKEVYEEVNETIRKYVDYIN